MKLKVQESTLIGEADILGGWDGKRWTTQVRVFGHDPKDAAEKAYALRDLIEHSCKVEGLFR